jgi:transcriptional regulator with XRE-family HTH domain
MKIEPQLTDEVILQELGGRLAALRLERNLTQSDLAQEAGVSKRTIERLESGEVATRLSGLLRVCRALGLMENLEALVPKSSPSPIAQLKLQGKLRKRASRNKLSADTSTKWTWGDTK